MVFSFPPPALAQVPAPLRILCFLLVLLLLWAPLGLPIVWWVADPDWQSILALGWLYILFIVWVRWWGRSLYRQPRILHYYGLGWNRLNLQQMAWGFCLGMSSLGALYGVQGWVGWLVWQSPDFRFPLTVAEGMAVGLAVGFAEELVFRGWILDELERDYGDRSAPWINALLFAVVHFLKPWTEILRTFPQFPGLMLLALTLVRAKRSCQGQLGMAIGLHGGLVAAYYWVAVGQLIRFTNQVPAWITGIDHNPLAGVLGLVFLAALAGYFHFRPTSQ